jgi:TetR/AcrR family transcriptional repressor of nem operon
MPTKHGAGCRERILLAAGALFRQRGYRHSSLEHILARADVRTISNFYYHFPSKEALALEVIDRWAREQEENVLKPSLGNSALGSLERLELLFELIDRRLGRHHYRGGSPLGNLAAEISGGHPQLRARLAYVFRRWERDIRACWRAGIEAGEIAPWVRPEVAAACTVAAIEGACAMSRVYRSPDPLRSMGRLYRWALRGTRQDARPRLARSTRAARVVRR